MVIDAYKFLLSEKYKKPIVAKETKKRKIETSSSPIQSKKTKETVPSSTVASKIRIEPKSNAGRPANVKKQYIGSGSKTPTIAPRPDFNRIEAEMILNSLLPEATVESTAEIEEVESPVNDSKDSTDDLPIQNLLNQTEGLEKKDPEGFLENPSPAVVKTEIQDGEGMIIEEVHPDSMIGQIQNTNPSPPPIVINPANPSVSTFGIIWCLSGISFR